MPAIFTVVAPYPYRHPVAAPDAPVGSELLRFIGQGRHRVAGIGVGCHRVRRNVLIQIHDLCNKGILSGIGAADRYRNGHGLRGGGGMPFDPDYLTVTGWDHYIIDPVGGAEDMEGNRCRIIRRQILICPQCDGGNHIRIYSVFYIRGLNFSFRRSFIKPDNTNAEGADDVGIVLLSSGAACPGGDAKVAEFQEH